MNNLNLFINEFNQNFHYLRSDLKISGINSWSSWIRGLILTPKILAPSELFKKISLILTDQRNSLPVCKADILKEKLICYTELHAPKKGAERSALFDELYETIDLIDGKGKRLESGFIFLESKEQASLDESKHLIKFNEESKTRYIPMNNIKLRVEEEFQLLFYVIHLYDPENHILVANAEETDLEIHPKMDTRVDHFAVLRVIFNCLIPEALSFLKADEIEDLKTKLSLLILDGKKAHPAYQDKLTRALNRAMEVLCRL